MFDWQTGNCRLVKKRQITKSAVSAFTEMPKNEYWDNIINHTNVLWWNVHFQYKYI